VPKTIHNNFIILIINAKRQSEERETKLHGAVFLLPGRESNEGRNFY
jgi:hypothetical protein